MVMTPSTLPSTDTIFKNALLRLPATQQLLNEARKPGKDLSVGLQTIQYLQSLLTAPMIGQGMHWWLKIVASEA